MPKAHETWKVLPHQPIEKLDEDLWRVEGILEGSPPLHRVMVVARAGDGSLVVHNAIALDDASMREIDAWGEVRTLVVPNGWHRLDAKIYRERYPAARVLCPSGARKKVEEVVPVTGSFADFGADPRISLETLDGTRDAEGAMVVRSAGGTSLVFTDAVFNMPHLEGLTGFILRHLTQSSGGPRVSRIARWFIVSDRAAFRAHLARLAELPDLRRILVAHHETIADEPARVLREVAASLG